MTAERQSARASIASEGSRARRRRWGTAAKRAASLLFFGLVVWLLGSKIGTIEWPQVAEALRAYEVSALLAAGALSMVGYAAAASYDVLGRHYVPHSLPPLRTLAINFIAYAFSLNLGALVGGWGFRVRLYARFALDGRQIARIIAFAVVTNWSGFVLLSGLVFLLRPPELPSPWPLAETGGRILGIALLAAVAAYLWLCAVGGMRRWRIRVRGLELAPPSLRIALLQLTLSSVSWLMIALAMAQLMPDGVPFHKLLAALFAASLIGAATHVPGSLGVLEGSMLVLLGPELERTRVLAALFAFRAIYYLLPLAFAAIGYAAVEYAARRHRRAPA